MSRRPDPRPWAAGTAAALFYLAFHSTYYNFDGVACAIAVELGDFRYLLHGNHLAYGPAAWLFDRLWRSLGYAGPALLPLQALSSLLGGAGVGAFLRLLLALRFPAPAAAAAAGGLALSHAWWFWSLEAQVYMLAALALLGASAEALRERPDPRRLGLWHALALLGHLGHAMLFPALAARLWPRGRARALLACAGWTAAALAAAYALAALAVRPRDLADARLWLLGSAALTKDRTFLWHGTLSWDGTRDWLASSLKILVLPGGEHPGLGWALAALPLAAAAWGASSAPPARRGLVRACLAWLLGYALLFTTWEPAVLVYRITDLIPVWLLAACALERLPRRACVPLAAAWLAAAGLYNGLVGLAPHLRPASNPEYQEALWLRRTAPEGAWVVVTGRAQVYVPYFAHLRPLNLRYYPDDGERLRRRLDALAEAGETVVVTEAVLRAGPWGAALRRYGLEEVLRGEGRALFRVRRKESPGAGGGRS